MSTAMMMQDSMTLPTPDHTRAVKIPSSMDGCVQIFPDRVVDHWNIDQGEKFDEPGRKRYQQTVIPFANIQEVIRDREHVGLRLGGGEREWYHLLLSESYRRTGRGVQTAYLLLRDGLHAFHGDRRAQQRFEQRIAKARTVYGDDITVQVTPVLPCTFERDDTIIEELILTSPEEVSALMVRLATCLQLPTERICDRSHPLPPMLEAYWNHPDGFQGVKMRESNYGGNRCWGHLVEDGFGDDWDGVTETEAREALTEAIGRPIYLRDRRLESSIRYLRRER